MVENATEKPTVTTEPPIAISPTAVARIPTDQELAQARQQREHRQALAFGLSGREEYVALRDSIAAGATPAEFNMHLLIAKRLGLSPVGGQVHFVKRMTRIKEKGQWTTKEVFSTQVGIDGFRAVAEGSNEYEGPAGMPLYRYPGPDPTWTEEERVDDNGQPVPPIAAKAGVWRKGWKEPVWASALYASYAEFKNVKDDSDVDPGYGGAAPEQATPRKVPTKMWAKMPHLMLAKCAEALALRKAFPAQLGGVHTAEEMAQANNDPDVVIDVVPSTPTTSTSGTDQQGRSQPSPDNEQAKIDEAVEKEQNRIVDQLNESLPKGQVWMGAMLKAKKAHLGLRGAFQDRLEAHVKAHGTGCEHVLAVTGEIKATTDNEPARPEPVTA